MAFCTPRAGAPAASRERGPMFNAPPNARLFVFHFTQLGHQAANCTSGTVNWKQIYGEEAFLLRPPIYESDLIARREGKKIDYDAITNRARDFAKTKAQSLGEDFDDILKQAEDMRVSDVAKWWCHWSACLETQHLC